MKAVRFERFERFERYVGTATVQTARARGLEVVATAKAHAARHAGHVAGRFVISVA